MSDWIRRGVKQKARSWSPGKGRFFVCVLLLIGIFVIQGCSAQADMSEVEEEPGLTSSKILVYSEEETPYKHFLKMVATHSRDFSRELVATYVYRKTN